MERSRRSGAANIRSVVAAGGFEGATDPSLVFTVQDTGAGSASAAYIGVLGNALGYFPEGDQFWRLSEGVPNC